MSNKAITIIVIIIIVLIGWWYFAKQSSQNSMNNGSNSTTTMEYQNSNPAGQTGQNQSGVGVNTSVSTTANTATNVAASASAKDNSDAAINKDLGNVDAEMNGLSSDSANADSGMNNPN